MARADEGDNTFVYDPAEEERKRREAELNAGLNQQKQTGGDGDLFTWQNDVQAMTYNNQDRNNKGGYVVDDNGNLQPRNPDAPSAAEQFNQYRQSNAGRGEKLPPAAQNYASSFAYGDYNYNPQGGFSYSPSPGYDGRVTGRDSQAYGDYNYNPPDWNQKPSDYNLPGDRTWPDEGRYTQQYQSNRPTYGGAPVGVGAGGGQAPRTTAAAPRTTTYASRYGSSGGGRGGSSGFNYGGGGGYNDQPQSVQAGLMNWRF